MPLFTVDEEKCLRDGLCAAECPAGIIAFKKDTLPSPVEDAEKRCINCGHCVAICPHGALSLASMPSEACPGVDRSLLPSSESFDHMVRTRRSIRNYKQDTLDPDLVEKLIDTARHAPTGSNSQQVGWTVANGREKTHELAALTIEWMKSIMDGKHPLARAYRLERIVGAWMNGQDGILRGAPGLVVTHAPKSYGSGAADCCIAMATFELAAYCNGLGACWAGFLLMAANSSESLVEALNLPKGHVPHAAMMFGNPKYRYQRIPLRKIPEINWIK